MSLWDVLVKQPITEIVSIRMDPYSFKHKDILYFALRSILLCINIFTLLASNNIDLEIKFKVIGKPAPIHSSLLTKYFLYSPSYSLSCLVLFILKRIRYLETFKIIKQRKNIYSFFEETIVDQTISESKYCKEYVWLFT